MKRWPFFPVALALAGPLLLTASAALVSQAHAQTATPARQFPPGVQRGVLRVITPPEVLLDGQSARLAPGARIFGVDNALVFSASLIGQDKGVNYRRDGMGQILQAWILSADELTQARDNATPQRNFSFASDAPATARDDGKTPFEQLPKYPAR